MAMATGSSSLSLPQHRSHLRFLHHYRKGAAEVVQRLQERDHAQPWQEAKSSAEDSAREVMACKECSAPPAAVWRCPCSHEREETYLPRRTCPESHAPRAGAAKTDGGPRRVSVLIGRS